MQADSFLSEPRGKHTNMEDGTKKGSVCKGGGGLEDEGPVPFSASELWLKLFPSSWNTLPTMLHTHTFPPHHCLVQKAPLPWNPPKSPRCFVLLQSLITFCLDCSTDHFISSSYYFKSDGLLFNHFAEEETQSQRGCIICPKLQNSFIIQLHLLFYRAAPCSLFVAQAVLFFKMLDTHSIEDDLKFFSPYIFALMCCSKNIVSTVDPLFYICYCIKWSLKRLSEF